jgi:monoamine oxidase
MPGSLYSRLNRTYGTPPPLTVKREAVQEKIRTTFDLHRFPLESVAEVYGQVAGKSVIVVGAGFAGLTAGYSLSQQGYRVTVLEARDRVGGRVFTDRISENGPLLECGGELIGRNHPTWLMFAQRFGLGLSVITPDEDYVYANDRRKYTDFAAPMWIAGKLRDAEEQNRLYVEMQWALKTLNEHASTVPAHMPWRAKNAAIWDQKTVAQWLESLDRRHCSEDAKAAIRFQIESDQTAPLEQQSYLGLLAAVRGGSLKRLSERSAEPSEFWSETEIFRCAAGNQELARRLCEEISKAGGTILTKTPVKTVEMDKDGVAVAPEKGDTIRGNWVIVAVPPSCWETMHLPVDWKPLRIQTGSAVKYLANTKSRFWLRDGLAPTANDDRFGMVWEGTDNQILPTQNGAEMTVFAGGPLADHALKEQDIDRYFTNALSRLYSGFTAEKSSHRFMDWRNEDWTWGGYSCPAPGQVTTASKALYEPNHRLVWAGEHCCMAYFGYMESALQSGLHAAQLIAAGDKVREAQELLEKKMESAQA